MGKTTNALLAGLVGLGLGVGGTVVADRIADGRPPGIEETTSDPCAYDKVLGYIEDGDFKGANGKGIPSIEVYPENPHESMFIEVRTYQIPQGGETGVCREPSVLLFEDDVPIGLKRIEKESENVSTYTAFLTGRTGNHMYRAVAFHPFGDGTTAIRKVSDTVKVNFSNRGVDKPAHVRICYISSGMAECIPDGEEPIRDVRIDIKDWFYNKGIRSVTLTDNGKPVELKRDDIFDNVIGTLYETWLPANPNYISSLAPGRHVLRVTVVDNGGNRAGDQGILAVSKPVKFVYRK